MSKISMFIVEIFETSIGVPFSNRDTSNRTASPRLNLIACLFYAFIKGAFLPMSAAIFITFNIFVLSGLFCICAYLILNAGLGQFNFGNF